MKVTASFREFDIVFLLVFWYEGTRVPEHGGARRGCARVRAKQRGDRRTELDHRCWRV